MAKNTRAVQVAVCGDSDPNSLHLKTAFQVGHLLADAGAVVLTGGGTGVMRAASDGARDAGGLVVSVLPAASTRGAEAPAGAYIATGLGEARNFVLVRSADAVIAIGGGFGTLSEIAIARKLRIPTFGISTWNATPPGSSQALLETCDSAMDAVSMALAAARG